MCDFMDDSESNIKPSLRTVWAQWIGEDTTVYKGTVFGRDLGHVGSRTKADEFGFCWVELQAKR